MHGIVKGIVSWVRARIFDIVSLVMAILFVVGTLAGYYIADNYMFTHAIVCGQSMFPTYKDGQKLFYAKGIKPQHDDVAIFDMNGTLVIKRVIGIGGDKIKIENSHIIRNGEVLNETYLNEPIFTGGNFEGKEITLAEDEYMLLGDNRNKSLDSREHGLFKEDTLQGTVIFRETK